MSTIQDVAKLAGVAPITVSRVINHSGYFSQEVREKVEAAIAELDYVPNTLARSLRSKRTNTLALIISDITNPFFTTLARGVEDAASDAGLTVIFCNTDESEAEEQKYLKMLLEKQVDGVLLVPAQSSLESLNMVRRNQTPLVVLDRAVPDETVDEVRCDSEGGAYQLVRLLLALGHRRIAVLSGPRGVSTADDRVAGYCRALREAHLPVEETLVLHGDFMQESGEEMTRQAMALEPRPTALFAANNFITIGAMKALQSAGLRVPEDVALVGFDDLPPALVTFPFFTVVSQPAYEMGRRATELLLERLEKSDLPARKIVLPTEIIVRRSSGGDIRLPAQPK
jgi:LacI family transcriptional regulator